MKSARGPFLLGDIGATRARLAIYYSGESPLKHLKVYPSKEFSSIFHLLTAYLDSLPERPETAILALAGPVIRGKAVMTNLGWKVDSEVLRKTLKFKKVILLNDLQALAYSIFSLDKEELFTLRDARVIRKYPRTFIAPGTGLGVSVMVSGKSFGILPTEAGHTLFSPLNDEELSFFQFLKRRGALPVWEEVLSGRGLVRLYEFITGRELSSEEIVNRAKGGEPASVEVISRFLGLLGRKCYELAVSYEPFGGIFLAGGLLLAMKEFLRKEEFLNGYFCNARLLGLLEVIPIFLILHPNPGLLGVQTIARSLSE